MKPTSGFVHSLLRASSLVSLVASVQALPKPQAECAPGTYFHPFDGCVSSCVEPFYLNNEQTTCVLLCTPSEQPNDDGSACMANCQENYIPDPSLSFCIPCAPGATSGGTAYQCDTDSPIDCEGGMIPQPDGSCQCADGWYWSPDGGCLIECIYPFKQDDSMTQCIKDCSYASGLVTSPDGQHCVTDPANGCPDGYEPWDTFQFKCSAVCPAGLRIDDGCVPAPEGAPACPGGQPVTSDPNYCAPVCKDGFVWHDDVMDCLLTCTPPLHLNDRGTSCEMIQCDEGEQPTEDGSKCVVSCDEGFTLTLNGRGCQENCPPGQSRIQDGPCRVDCPDGQRANFDNTGCMCRTLDRVLVEGVCVCSEEYTTDDNGQCQESCPWPQSYDYDTKGCDCSSPYFTYVDVDGAQVCQLSCPDPLVPNEWNNYCTCPDGMVEVSEGVCDWDEDPQPQGCPGDKKPLGPNGECQCPPGKIEDVEDTCASTGTRICDGDKVFDDSGTYCICPAGTTDVGNDVCTRTSTSTCTVANEVFENGECVCKAPNFYMVGNDCVKRTLTVPDTPGWNYQGCWVDTVASRTLADGAFQGGDSNSIDTCLAFCSGLAFKYAGVEYAGECYCSNTLLQGTAAQSIPDCNMPCTGNSSQPCGGPGRLDLFESSTVASAPSIAQGSGGFDYLGCYTDEIGSRTLPVSMDVSGGSGGMTAEKCIAACANGSFKYAGLEYAGECYCGNDILSTKKVDDGQCSMPCNGNKNEYCGAGGRLTVYKAGPGVAPVSTVTLPTGWTANGCYSDNQGGRTLRHGIDVPGGNGAMTVELCIAACADNGYTIAGLEYAQECWCDSQYNFNGASVTDGCTMPCKGKSAQICGGPDRLNVYTLGN